MNVLDIRQGSKQWFDARLGMVTSTRVAAAIGRLKRRSGDKKPGESSAMRERLKLELIAETIKKEPLNHYVSEWMELGKEREPLARSAYEMLTGNEVDLIGLVMHPHISRAAASPDGMVNGKIFTEFKVPKLMTHLVYLKEDRVPPEYVPQMMWQVACADEIEAADFCSHCSELPKPYDTFVKRLPRDEKWIADTEAEVIQFLKEVDELWDQLKERFGAESIIERKLKQSIAIARGAGPQLITKALEVSAEDCV